MWAEALAYYSSFTIHPSCAIWVQLIYSQCEGKGAAMPCPVCFGPKRRAVVGLDQGPDTKQSTVDTRQSTVETAGASAQTVIGLTAYPKLFLHDWREAPLYVSRREAELFLKRRRHHVATQTDLE